MAALPGDELAPFVLPSVEGLRTGEKKGSGAYGAVYRITVDGVPCIVKRIHEILLDRRIVSPQEKDAIQRKFRQECVILSKLRHPNVVHFVGVQYGVDNELSLVMECLHTDLGTCLEAHPTIPLSVKLAILLDVSYGLLYLHSLPPPSGPIIHRDLSAGNVLLTIDMRAKIADLGVSKLLSRRAQTTILQTKAPGTADYMPPEALKEKPEYDTKLDVFSLGHLTLYTVNQKIPSVYEVMGTDAILGIQQGTLQIFRRRTALEEMGRDHCLYSLATRCLQDSPARRPTTLELSSQLTRLAAMHPRTAEDVMQASGTWSKVEAMMAELEQLRRLLQTSEEERDAALGRISKLEDDVNTTEKQLGDKLQATEQRMMDLQAAYQRMEAEKEQLQQLGEVRAELQVAQQRITEVEAEKQQGVLVINPRNQSQTRILRDQIIEALRGIKLRQGQALRTVDVPPHVYEGAKEFVKTIPPDEAIFRTYCMYDILNPGETQLPEAEAKIAEWQSGCKALLRYALNLLLAPKRPEYRRLKLSNSYYMYQVAKKLQHAEEVLMAMGYKRTGSSQEIQELSYEGEVNIATLHEAATDLVFLYSELELLKEVVQQILSNPKYQRLPARVTLQTLLDARKRDIPFRYDSMWGHLMKLVYRQQAKQSWHEDAQLYQNAPGIQPATASSQHYYNLPMQSGVATPVGSTVNSSSSNGIYQNLPSANTTNTPSSNSEVTNTGRDPNLRSIETRLRGIFQQYPDLVGNKSAQGDYYPVNSPQQSESSFDPSDLPPPMVESTQQLQNLQRFFSHDTGTPTSGVAVPGYTQPSRKKLQQKSRSFDAFEEERPSPQLKHHHSASRLDHMEMPPSQVPSSGATEKVKQFDKHLPKIYGVSQNQMRPRVSATSSKSRDNSEKLTIDDLSQGIANPQKPVPMPRNRHSHGDPQRELPRGHSDGQSQHRSEIPCPKVVRRRTMEKSPPIMDNSKANILQDSAAVDTSKGTIVPVWPKEAESSLDHEGRARIPSLFANTETEFKDFWICKYCTNIVDKHLHVCDVCASSRV